MFIFFDYKIIAALSGRFNFVGSWAVYWAGAHFLSYPLFGLFLSPVLAVFMECFLLPCQFDDFDPENWHLTMSIAAATTTTTTTTTTHYGMFE